MPNEKEKMSKIVIFWSKFTFPIICSFNFHKTGCFTQTLPFKTVVFESEGVSSLKLFLIFVVLGSHHGIHCISRACRYYCYGTNYGIFYGDNFEFICIFIGQVWVKCMISNAINSIPKMFATVNFCMFVTVWNEFVPNSRIRIYYLLRAWHCRIIFDPFIKSARTRIKLWRLVWIRPKRVKRGQNWSRFQDNKHQNM